MSKQARSLKIRCGPSGTREVLRQIKRQKEGERRALERRRKRLVK